MRLAVKWLGSMNKESTRACPVERQAVASYKVLGKREGEGYLDLIYKKKKEKIAEVREKESKVVKLARKAVEEYIKNKKRLDPSTVDSELAKKGGVFVSIKKDGILRGCIGTLWATEDNIAREIIKNSLAAAFEDSRFESVNLKQLEELVYTVDIIGELKEVDDLNSLDPKKYGVIVDKGGKRGLLLPDLVGVDTVKKQLEIAKRKAGIPLEEEDLKIMSFEVERYK